MAFSFLLPLKCPGSWFSDVLRGRGSGPSCGLRGLETEIWTARAPWLFLWASGLTHIFPSLSLGLPVCHLACICFLGARRRIQDEIGGVNFSSLVETKRAAAAV